MTNFTNPLYVPSQTPSVQVAASTKSSTNIADEFFAKFYQKADSLDETIRTLAEQMNGDRERIDALTNALTELRNNRPDAESGTGTFNRETVKALEAQGFDVSALGISGSMTQAQFDTAITNVKAQLDQANSVSQEMVIELQQTTNQLTQIFELMSNFMSKFGTAVSNILGNIR